MAAVCSLFLLKLKTAKIPMPSSCRRVEKASWKLYEQVWDVHYAGREAAACD